MAKAPPKLDTLTGKLEDVSTEGLTEEEKKSVAYLQRPEVGISIHFDEHLSIAVEISALEAMTERVRSIPIDERPKLKASVGDALIRIKPRLLRNEASKKECDTAYYDMLIWGALQRIAN